MLKLLKTRFLPKIYYLKVFRVTDHQYAVRVERFFDARWEIQDGRSKIVPINAKNETYT